VTHAVIGDVTNEAFLNSIGIRHFDVAIVAIGEDLQSSIFTTIILKESGVRYIVSKAQDELHARILEKVGADRVVFPEKDMGVRVAYSLSATKVLDFIELSPTDSIMEIVPYKTWIEKSLKDSKIREKYGVSIIAIKNGDSIIAAPKADYVIRDGDILVIIGSNENISKLQHVR
jgi:trk system potassium uptake protein TrkA